MARLNTHLAGLVSIKKQTVIPPEYAALREMAESASLAALKDRIAQLPAALQPPFAPWLDAVRARDAALTELSALPALDGTP